MSIARIMNATPITLSADEPVSAAIARMIERKVRSFPVVDADGRYLGMFGLHRVLGMLLPRVVTMEDECADMDLSFISNGAEYLKDKLAEIGGESVLAYVDRERPVAHPDTPLVEAVLLVYRTGANLPVVEHDSGRLAGVLTPWDILLHVT